MQKQPQKGLTNNQEKFVQCLIRGLSQRQAYYQAYPKSKSWNENSVDNKASVLWRNAKVRARYDELNKKLVEKEENNTIYSAKQLREFWTKILCDDESDMRNRLKASELLAKSQGVFIEKRETTINNEDCVIRIVKNDN